MSPPESRPAGAGWFGKVPSLGDFAIRRLPASFVEPWYQWLSGELSDARSVLGEAWPSIYEQAPISCFWLAPQTVDESAWQGILVPSVDRVGRQFPLTLAAPAVATRTSRWWALLVASGRLGLERTRRADDIDAALVSVAAEPDLEGMERPPTTVADGKSEWWTWSENPAQAAVTCTVGLPRAAGFRRLLGARQEPL